MNFSSLGGTLITLDLAAAANCRQGMAPFIFKYMIIYQCFIRYY